MWYAVKIFNHHALTLTIYLTRTQHVMIIGVFFISVKFYVGIKKKRMPLLKRVCDRMPSLDFLRRHYTIVLSVFQLENEKGRVPGRALLA